VARPASRLERQIDFLVSRRLGDSAEWVLYDRTPPPSPMSFTLDQAERELGSQVQVVWVWGGYPELFTLRALECPIVVYSSRFLELTAFFRSLFVDGFWGDLREEVARSLCLTVAADLALLSGEPDRAVGLFLQSKLGTGIHVELASVQKLEQMPIDETYMVVWFYGLLHELGHSAPETSKPTGVLLSSEALEGEIQSQLEVFSAESGRDLRGVLEEARAGDSDHPLSADHLRGEIEADIFAAGVLATAALAIRLADATLEPFDPDAFIAEVFVYLNVITLVQRCRSAVTVASAGHATRSGRASVALEPVGTAVRVALLRRYLPYPLALASSGGEPAAHIDGWRDAVDRKFGGFDEEIGLINSGLLAALVVILSDPEPLDQLLAAAASEHGENPVFKDEAGSLAARGRALGLDSEAFATLERLAS
jgi:hypothetical protein